MPIEAGPESMSEKILKVLTASDIWVCQEADTTTLKSPRFPKELIRKNRSW
jgi:hypothetical protein